MRTKVNNSWHLQTAEDIKAMAKQIGAPAPTPEIIKGVLTAMKDPRFNDEIAIRIVKGQVPPNAYKNEYDDGGWEVVVTGRDYQTETKQFKLKPSDVSPSRVESQAREYARKLEAKDKASSHGLYRSIDVRRIQNTGQFYDLGFQAGQTGASKQSNPAKTDEDKADWLKGYQAGAEAKGFENSVVEKFGSISEALQAFQARGFTPNKLPDGDYLMVKGSGGTAEKVLVKADGSTEVITTRRKNANPAYQNGRLRAEQHLANTTGPGVGKNGTGGKFGNAKRKFMYQGLEYEFDQATKMVSGGRYAFPFAVSMAPAPMQKILASKFPTDVDGKFNNANKMTTRQARQTLYQSGSYANGRAKAQEALGIENSMPDTIAKLEAKGFHGLIDKLKRGEIDEAEAISQLAGNKPTGFKPKGVNLEPTIFGRDYDTIAKMQKSGKLR